MKLPKISTIRNKAITSIFVLLAMFIMATPAFANTSSWSFLAFYDGRVINGKTNGGFSPDDCWRFDDQWNHKDNSGIWESTDSQALVF